MRVLLVESHRGIGSWATEVLESASHEVVTCHDGENAYPCGVFDNPSTCPLEHLAARPHGDRTGTEDPSRMEEGLC
jgi:hypothetical protein